MHTYSKLLADTSKRIVPRILVASRCWAPSRLVSSTTTWVTACVYR